MANLRMIKKPRAALLHSSFLPQCTRLVHFGRASPRAAHLISFFIILGTILCSCGDGFHKVAVPAPRPVLNPASVKWVSGRFESTEGELIALGGDHARPWVIVMATDLCSTCIQEVNELKKHLPDPKLAPEKFELVSLLVASNRVDATAWKAEHEIPWKVIYSMDGLPLETYCAEMKVPCVLIQLPEKGIVFSKNGKVNYEEIATHTGEWK